VSPTDWYRALTAPARVAIVGASADPAKGGLLRNLVRLGFAGEIVPVNPRVGEIDGLTTAPSVAAIEGPVDLALIVVPAWHVPGVVAECGDAGVPVAYVMSSGFGELGEEGAELERAAVANASRTGLRLLGPNSNGVISARGGLAGSIMTATEDFRPPLVDDGVAVITQSGAIGGFLVPKLLEAGLGVGSYFSTGNESDVGFAELLERLVDDPDVRAVLGYVEGLRDGPAFVRAAARARAAGKPIVVLKVGVSDEGAHASASHTGAVTGSDAVYDGVFRQLGVRRTENLRQLIDAGVILGRTHRPMGRRLGIVTISGGLAVMSIDHAARRRLEVPAWTSATRDRIAELLPPYVGVRNPLDTTGVMADDPLLLHELLTAADEEPETDVTLLSLGGSHHREAAVVDALSALAPTLRKPLLVVWVGGSSGLARDRLPRTGLPVFETVEDAIDAIAVVAELPTGREVGEINPSPAPNQHALNVAEQLVAAARARSLTMLDEVDGKQILRAFGIPCVEETVVSSAAGVPLVLPGMAPTIVAKLRSARLSHKSDIDGVQLNLRGTEAVASAVTDLLERAGRLGLDDAEVVLQDQVDIGAELLLGASQDPTFGPVVTLGLGGTGAELAPDRQIRLPVIARADVDDMVGGLRAHRLLEGFRGAAAIDRGQLAELVQRFGAMIVQLSHEVADVDINPLVCRRSDGTLVAVDALFVLKARPTARLAFDVNSKAPPRAAPSTGPGTEQMGAPVSRTLRSETGA
jgi:acetate---CoA ligase (ADP-forming)